MKWQGFLCNTFIAFLYNDYFVFRVLSLMNDQLLKQYSIWEKIIECKHNLAASTVKNGLS